MKRLRETDLLVDSLAPAVAASFAADRERSTRIFRMEECPDAAHALVESGLLVDGVVFATPPSPLARAPPSNVAMKQDGQTTENPAAKRLVEWKTGQRTTPYWLTPRVKNQSASRVLTARCVSDLPTQLRFEKTYVERFTPEVRGTVVSPEFGEWMMGLPRNYTDWTSRDVEPLPPLAEEPPLRSLDLFTGCGGLTLGIRRWARPVAYCEADAQARLILQSRIDTGHLPNATVFDDVRTLTEEGLRTDLSVPRDEPLSRSIDVIVAGFPCQDLSRTGTRKGLDGPRSSLFHRVVEIVDFVRPPLVLLENVHTLLSAKHHTAWKAVLRAFDRLGYDARWRVLQATHGGAPHQRKRWFLLAIHRGVVPKASPQWAPLGDQAKTASTWPEPPPLERRMHDHDFAATGRETRIGTAKPRLAAIGNMVCVPQAAVAMHMLLFGLKHRV